MCAGRATATLPGMLPLLARSACAALGALALLAPGVAVAKPKKRLNEATYTVIARATMEEEWQFLERSEIDCLDGMCTTETKGSGTATMQLKAKPTKWLVMRGFGGRPPMINVGTGEGVQLKGPYLRSGELSTVHGGPWADANPPRIAPTGDCGNRSITVDFNLMWKARNQLSPSAIVDDLREDCPDGPSTGLEWDSDSPSLMDVVTQAAQTKFLRTKQFTVSGTKTWHASVDPPTGAYTMRSGQKLVTWNWSVTFHMNRKGRR
jgi:hypothetical protein